MSEDILKDSWEPKGKISEEIQKRIKKAGGRAWANDNISEFIEDGEKNLVLNSPIEFEGSVYLYHGMMDSDVPTKLSKKVLNNITISNDIKLILEKHGEHRLSKDKEIDTIKSLLKQISNY